MSSSPNPLIPDSLARMLQQHHQFHAANNNSNSSQPTEPHHKAFVCEICGKAFRFRSNLAEHRSVHTAVKPFVCKFCGKSSRLKGNLTKHILKHHKTEQREHIGTEDYIIKKGKKSVKDPAAIEFLEQSMIVLNNNNSARGATTTAANQQQMPAQNDGEEQNGGDESPLEGAITANSILLSLGLGIGSANLDLKEESISDAGADEGNNCAGMMMEFGTNEGENAIGMEGSGAEGEGEEEEGDEEGEGEMDGNSPQQSSSGQQSPQQPTVGQSTLFGGAGTNALAAAACKAIFGQFEAKHLAKALMGTGPMGRVESAGEQAGNGGGGEEMLKLLAASFGAAGASGEGQSTKQQQVMMDDGRGEQQQQQTQQMPMANSGNGFRLAATQCQICSKHFRKPRDLIAHLSNAHKTLPNGASCPSPSSSSAPLPADDFGGGGGDISSPKSTSKRGNEGNGGGGGDEIVLQELRELREILVGIKAGNGGMAKVEQMLGQLDSRVCRLEKQLEMALNSIYTLVQLQTGINNSVNKLSRLNNNNNNNS